MAGGITLWQQHPVFSFLCIASVLMLSGWCDRATGLRTIAHWNWFLGGALGVAALACGIMGNPWLLGPFRWPAVAIFVPTALYLLWRLRPRASRHIR
jgi:hypothetical protein